MCMKIYLMLNHVLPDEESGQHIKGWWYSIDVEGTLGWTHPWVLGFWSLSRPSKHHRCPSHHIYQMDQCGRVHELEGIDRGVSSVSCWLKSCRVGDQGKVRKLQSQTQPDFM